MFFSGPESLSLFIKPAIIAEETETRQRERRAGKINSILLSEFLVPFNCEFAFNTEHDHDSVAPGPGPVQHVSVLYVNCDACVPKTQMSFWRKLVTQTYSVSVCWIEFK